MRWRLLLAACAVSLLMSAFYAQPQAQRLKPSPSNSPQTPRSKLALEIFYNATLPPAYLTVDGPNDKPHWIWMARFATVPGWTLPPGSSPIFAVRVQGQWNGETADVRVSLLRGNSGYDQEELVGNYQIGIDESRTIAGLEKYGVKPFKITLVTPKAPLPGPIAIENQTVSVDIIKVEPENVPLPSYRLTFKNFSHKRVAALAFGIVRDGRPEQRAFRQSQGEHPLIAANGEREEHLPATVSKSDGISYVPSVATNNILHISAVVFMDGTFEGDVNSACKYESFVIGRRVWVKKIIGLIDETRTEVDDDAKAASDFRLLVSGLTPKAIQTPLPTQSVVSPACGDPLQLVDLTFNSRKVELLRELDTIIQTRPHPRVVFNEWLQSTHSKYKKWLAGLDDFGANKP